MRISIKSLLIVIWGLGGICSVRGEVFGELNLGWNLYLNPQGKYQLVSAPTSENPYNWEAEERIDYNAFELGWAILGWRGMLNNNFKTTVSFIVEDVEEAGLNFQLERAYLERSWGENFFLDFQAGYFLTSWMEWIRGYLWDWDWLAHPVVEELGLVPSSQLGILVNGGWGNGKAKLGVKLAGLTEPPFDSNYNRWELGVFARGGSSSFGIYGAGNYSQRGKPEEEGWQELWQAGAGLEYQGIKLGGEYFQGRSWIPAGEVYLLGNFPEGVWEFFELYGRNFIKGEEIEFWGWSGFLTIQPEEELAMVWRYDFFDPSKRFDDDRENLFLLSLLWKTKDSFWFGLSYQRQDFQSHNLPDLDQEDELEPIETLSVRVLAQFP